MSDIFISYSSKDRARAEVLAGALERQGWSVWWDRRIPPGKQFSQVIKEAMDEARCVIVLWSKESVKSEWVQNEASEGARRKILVPALIEDVEIPFEFRRIQAARLVDWEGRSPNPEFETLLEALSAILGQPSLPQRDSEAPSGNAFAHQKSTDMETEKAGSKSRTAKVLAAICIVALITIASIGIFLKFRQPTIPLPMEVNAPVPDERPVTPQPAVRTHGGPDHPGCIPFQDPEETVSRGPITMVEVAHNGVVYGIRLRYGPHDYGDWHLGPRINELSTYSITTTPWQVPEGQRIVRIEGGTFQGYISRLKFVTDSNFASEQFGKEMDPDTEFEAKASSMPLRTISGSVNTREHESKSNIRAIRRMMFHFAPD